VEVASTHCGFIDGAFIPTRKRRDAVDRESLRARKGCQFADIPEKLSAGRYLDFLNLAMNEVHGLISSTCLDGTRELKGSSIGIRMPRCQDVEKKEIRMVGLRLNSKRSTNPIKAPWATGRS